MAFDLLIGVAGSQIQLALTADALPPVLGTVLRRLRAEPGVAYAAPIGILFCMQSFSGPACSRNMHHVA